MKNLSLFVIFFLILISAKSQDIIIKKSGDEVKAKILEVGTTEIKYKRFDYQDGPIYTILKSEVLVVRYENGINEVINTAPSTTTPPVTNPNNSSTVITSPSTSDKAKIEYKYGSYNQNGRYISKYRVVNILKNTNDAEINRLLTKSENSRTTGNVIATALGIPLMVVGTLTTIRGAAIASGDVVDPDAGGIITVGAVMTGMGLTLEFANIGFHARSKKHLDNAIAIFNKKYAE